MVTDIYTRKQTYFSTCYHNWLTLMCLHAVHSNLSKLGPYHSVCTRKVDVAVSSERDTWWRQKILLVKALDQLGQLLLWNLRNKGIENIGLVWIKHLNLNQEKSSKFTEKELGTKDICIIKIDINKPILQK